MFVDILAGLTMLFGFGVVVYGMKKYGIFSIMMVVLLFGIPTYAQNISSCNSIVSDYSGILQKDAGTVKIEQAAQALINQGADIKVVALDNSGGNLDVAESKLEKSCIEWQSANGGRKSTLIVLMVAVKDRKLGIYYGAAWHKALDDHWNRIKTDYMVPRFKDANFVGGFVAAEEQLANRIKASKDEALKPVVNQSTTVNQAADYSGLWVFFKWVLWFFAIGFLGWVIYDVVKRKKQEKSERDAAQAKAIVEMNKAAQGITSLRDKIEEKKALSEDITTAQSYYASASEEFTRLSDNLRTDPNTENMDTATYEALISQYSWVNTQLASGLSALVSNKIYPAEQIHIERSRSNKHTSGIKEKQVSAIPAPIVPTSPAPSQVIYKEPKEVGQPSTNVVIVNNETTHYEPPRYEPPVYTPAPEITHHHSSYDEGSSGGGGSSSWSSFDDSNSSRASEDSGGSSGFDSGGGGGFDSGDGGSSSF